MDSDFNFAHNSVLSLLLPSSHAQTDDRGCEFDNKIFAIEGEWFKWLSENLIGVFVTRNSYNSGNV